MSLSLHGLGCLVYPEKWVLKQLQLPGLSSRPHPPSSCRALWQLPQSPLLPARLMLGICPRHSLSLAKPRIESVTPACVFLQSPDLRGRWVLGGLQDLSVPITLRASTCPRPLPENLLGGNCKFIAGVNNPMGRTGQAAAF